MIFDPLSIAGAFLVRPVANTDERGSFTRTYCRDAFAEAGVAFEIQQCSTSFNTHKHTLRGMHFQAAPDAETKLVRCTRGAAQHVILDLRPDSETCGSWQAVELNADNRHLLYVPERVAHGFITLCDATEIYYEISASFVPGSARGVRWDDPRFAIDWPATPAVISRRDAGWPDFED